MQDVDLSLVSTEAMWDELSSRFEAAALVVMWRPDEDGDATEAMWKGGFATALGLFTLGVNRVLQQDAAASEFTPDGDNGPL